MIHKAKALYNDPLFRNSVYLMLSTGTMAGFGFLFWVLVAHLYQPQQVGIASTLISAMNFIAYVSLLGVNSTFIRFLPKSKSRNKQIDTGLILVALAAVIAGGFFIVFAPHFAPRLSLLHSHLAYSLIFILLCIGTTVNLVADSIFVAYRAAVYNLLVDGFVAGSIQLVLPLALVSFGAYGIYAAQGAAAFIAMVASIFFLVKKFNYKPRIKVSRVVIEEIRHYSLVSYVSSLFNIIPTLVLPIIILDKIGAAPAGYYYLATMMANVLFAIAYGIAQSLFAEGSYGEKRLFALIKRAMFFLTIGIIPASAILAVIGPYVLEIFGKGYGVHARGAIMVLAASGPAVAAYAIGNTIVSITKQLKVLVGMNFVYAIVVCGSALLLAHRGLTWIAGAWLLGNLAAAVVAFIFIGVHHYRRLRIVRKPA